MKKKACASAKVHNSNPAVGPRTLGPVSDLERHLPSEWWQDLFNSFYLKTDGDVVENDCNTIQDIDVVLDILKPTPESRIFDLCCGQGRHTLELSRRGFKNVTGLDRSRYLVRLARNRAKAQDLPAVFREGDARKIRIPKEPFDYVLILGNSFGYFEQQEDDLAVLQSVFSSLAPGGKLFMDIADGAWMKENFEKRSWEWIDQQHFVCRERCLASDQKRLISREVISHAEKGILADQFYAERLYTADEIQELLHRAGFTAIEVHESPDTQSTRGCDLGMMANRLVVTCQVPLSTPAANRLPFPKISVLLGDPRLEDQVKLNGQFNPEDFATINRLHEALSELKDFSFEYLDNHAELLKILQSNKKPEFIFNLCDEGFRNNAFHELHVPATLEMFDVPYTGAGPACLGLCYNKGLIRAVAHSLDIPTPNETYTGPYDKLTTLPSSFPVLVKPNYGDSSVGITKDAVIKDKESLIGYIDWLRTEFGRIGILIQEYLCGQEYSVGIVGNTGLTYKILPPLEVDYTSLPNGLPHILGYESKWDPKSPYWNNISYKPADLDAESQRQLFDYSNKLFERLACRDYARFDFRRDANGQIKLLEVNPNPGWCWDGKLNLMAGFDGISYSELLNMIISAGIERQISGQQSDDDGV